MEQRIADRIKDAEMILIGIGEEFAPELPLHGRTENEAACAGEKAADFACPPYTKEELIPYYKSRFYRGIPDNHRILQAYNQLRHMIGARPYFVVTLNTDDLIYRSELENDLIAAPCGSMGKMQCREHIVDAAPICEAVLAQQDVSAALCPVCGAPLQFHTVKEEGYLESGYLKQWEKYTRWLGCTLNRKLAVLELGVGFDYPQVVRFPFEKTAFYNRKADFIRVNSKFPQLPAELAQRGISIARNPVELLSELQ